MLARFALLASTFFLPVVASAHEVYVLTPTQIAKDLSEKSFSDMAVIGAHMGAFIFWAFIACLVVFLVFFASISRRLERRFDPMFARLKHYAPAVARVTIGISFLAWAYYGASFGPELPLSESFGALTPFIEALLVVVGLAITIGWYTRLAALAAAAIFAVVAVRYGVYLLTYSNYFGEIIVLLLIGTHRGGLERARFVSERSRHALDALAKKIAPYSFVILRVAFGVSLLYASIYAKFIHNALALDVAQLPLAGHSSSIASALGFEPHFLVLGAGIIEVLIALFFIFGIEIRFTALFVEFWLMLSLLYFGEVVWPHIILIGIPIAFLLYGYDKYSLEGWLFKKGRREPVF